MESDANKTTRESFNLAFGERLTAAFNGVLPDTNTQRAFIKSLETGLHSGPQRDTVRRWLLGHNAPDLFTLFQLIELLRSQSNLDYDANYLLLGEQSTDGAQPGEIGEIRETLKTVQHDVRDIADRMRDDKLGFEGVIMRQTIRMLEALRGGGPFATSSGEPRVAGFLPDDLLYLIEERSHHIRIVTLRLDYVLDEASLLPESLNRSSFRGRFASLVADNIRAGREYEFILPSYTRDWSDPVQKYRERIGSFVKDGPLIDRCLCFSVTDHPIGSGFVLFEIDPKEIYENPSGQNTGGRDALFRELEEAYLYQPKPDGPVYVGVTMAPSSRTHGVFVMDRDRVADALLAWDAYAKSSKPAIPAG